MTTSANQFNQCVEFVCSSEYIIISGQFIPDFQTPKNIISCFIKYQYKKAVRCFLKYYTLLLLLLLLELELYLGHYSEEQHVYKLDLSYIFQSKLLK